MKTNKIIFLIIIMIGFASGYEIICTDNSGLSGMTLWNYNITSADANETLTTLLQTEDFKNCTMVESNISDFKKCEANFKPLINILNNNIIEKNQKITEDSSRIKKMATISILLFFIMAFFLVYKIKCQKTIQ